MKKLIFTIIMALLSFVMTAGPVREVICETKKVLANEIYEIIVKNSDSSRTYTLYKGTTPMATLPGNGENLIFKGAWGNGTFRISDDDGTEMNNTVTITAYWLNNYPFNTTSHVPPPPILLPDGGVHSLELFTTSPGPDPSELEEVFRRYNSGENPEWDPTTMFIEVAEIIKESNGNRYYVNVYCAPNIGSEIVSNNACFSAYGSDSYGWFHQYGGGRLTDWGMECVTYGDGSRSIRLTGTQPLVRYILYNYGVAVRELIRKGPDPIEFRNLGPGKYTVSAEYKGNTLTNDETITFAGNDILYDVPILTCRTPFHDMPAEGGQTTLEVTKAGNITDSIISQTLTEFNSSTENVSIHVGSSSADDIVLNINVGANLSGSEATHELGFIHHADRVFTICQPELKLAETYNVTCDTTASVIFLSGSQTGWTYILTYEDGTPTGITRNGNGGPIAFTGMTSGQAYRVIAESTYQGRTVRKDMSGVAALTSEPQHHVTNTVKSVSKTTILDEDRAFTDITYFNGLGYEEQIVEHQAGGEGINIVQPFVYDKMNRADTKMMMPFAQKQSFAYRSPSPEMEQREYYENLPESEADSHPYSENIYEASPMQRILEARRAGDEYRTHQKSTRFGYDLNSEEDWVFEFSPGNGEYKIIATGYAAPGTLHKKTTEDEDGHKKETYTDTDGEVVLERQYMENLNTLETYYVRDPYFKRLICVIPPQESRKLHTGRTISYNTSSDDLCWWYSYDGYGRVIRKKVPGAGQHTFIYDRAGRTVLAQDNINAAFGQWKAFVYDDSDRVTHEYLIKTGLSESALRERMEDATLEECRTIIEEATSALPYAIRTYGETDIPEGLQFETSSSFTAMPLRKPVGLLRFERIYCPKGYDSIDTTDFVERTFFYDCRGRTIQTVSRHSDGTDGRVRYEYDRQGNITRMCETVCIDGTLTDTLEMIAGYDNRGRIVSKEWRLNGTPALVTYSYDELGRMKEKTVVSDTVSVCEQYRYNIRGMLTGKDCDWFSMRLRYHDPIDGEPSFTGRISQLSWTRGQQGPVESYTYAYDRAGRLTDAVRTSNSFETIERMTLKGAYAPYSETGITYDRNGNMLSLSRIGRSGADSFIMGYEGNQLRFVSRNGTALGNCYHDPNGNMSYAPHMGMSFSFNGRNYIEKVYTNGSTLVNYSYLADGSKLSATDGEGDGLLYRGSLIYRKTGDDIELESAAFSEGRFVRSAGGIIRPMIHITDHLGSVRAVVDGLTGQTVETNDYYPFGSRWEDEDGISDPTNRYRFNGKEDQEGEFGVPTLDYGARHYTPSSARWLSMDPLSEKYYGVSPYAFCNNDPVNFVDLDGRDFFDKFVGYSLGVLTNVVPGTGRIRDLYTPNDSQDYNSALRATDNATTTIGKGMTIVGGAGMITGSTAATVGIGVTIASGGTAAVVGAPVAALGTEVAIAGAKATAAGMILMANSAENKSGGYERGNTSSGNKNSKHANQDAKNSAKVKYEEAKKNYETYKRIANKTPDEIKRTDYYKKQVKHWKKKMDFSGENHSNTVKGN